MKRRDMLKGLAALAMPAVAAARKAAPDYMPIVAGRMAGYQPWYVERELTEPTVLLGPDGKLNPAARGWSRRPLVRANLSGHPFRKKRWNFWNFITPAFVFSITIADIDYASFCSLDLADFETKKSWSSMALGRGGKIAMPEEVEKSLAWKGGGTDASLDHFGTGIRVRFTGKLGGQEGHGEFVIHKPEGHETLNIVVPWSDERFQMNSKHNTLPVEGEVFVGGRSWKMRPEECYAVQDFGRGIWPYRSYWNWGVLNGMVDGQTIGVNMGARWTTGTGANENGICYGGKLHKVMEDLRWDYDPNDWSKPWRIKSEHTDVIDLTLTPFLVRDTSLSLGVVATGGACAFGRYNGMLRFEGRELPIKDIVGWAEEFKHRW